jgi:fructan beta-fructosidase
MNQFSRIHLPSLLLCAVILLLLAPSLLAEEPKRGDITLAEFELDTYGAWQVEGTAFGGGPAQGALKGQMPVEGFLGKGLVNSFNGGDNTTGKLTSPVFKIERKFITFLIGGGGFANETCMNLLIDGKAVRTATGNNTKPGGEEALDLASWDVSEFAGKEARIQVVDQRQGGWGHINVDHLMHTDTNAVSAMVTLEKSLTVNGTHLLVPVSNSKRSKALLLGIYDGDTQVQNFTITLPQDKEVSWLAAYPLEPFGLKGKQIKVAPEDGKRLSERYRAAFEQIKIGSASEAQGATDYAQPYRNQFHASTRRGWNNDPNGMVFHGGKYHLYYQYNPFGIQWGNMHWGHLESTDLVHWKELPIALFQKTVRDAAFSGGGFVDVNNTAGLGKGTLFIAFTSTGRGECLAYSKDEGLTFTELPENPVVKHKGRDPKIIWYQPEQKWVMVVYDETACAETDAIPPTDDKANASRNLAFYESKNLRQWTRTGAFTHADRGSVFECPELFELPITGKSGESRWIIMAAQNRYFIGKFDGKTFHQEAGPLGTTHGALYAAQTFSDVPDARRIQIGWVRTDSFENHFPGQIVNQAFTLPHEMTLRETPAGLRVFFSPVKEVEKLRGAVLAEGKDLTIEQANALLQKCQGEHTETLLEFTNAGPRKLMINGMDASFDGRSVRVFTDSTCNEVYADDGISYEVRKRANNHFDSKETKLTATEGTIRSLKIFRLKSIWKQQ